MGVCVVWWLVGCVCGLCVYDIFVLLLRVPWSTHGQRTNINIPQYFLFCTPLPFTPLPITYPPLHPPLLSHHIPYTPQASAVAAAQAALLEAAEGSSEEDVDAESANGLTRAEIPVVIKADVWGSAQAVEQALLQMQSDRVCVWEGGG